MKPAILIIALLAVSTVLSAQEKDNVTNFWAVKWVPTGTFYPTFPNIRLAVEKKWNKIGISNQVGVSIPNDRPMDSVFWGGSRGFIDRLEFRRYSLTKPSHKMRALFYGVQLFYAYSKKTIVDEFEDGISQPGAMTYFDEYIEIKNLYGLKGLFGAQCSFGPHFLLEFHTGLGVKVRNIVQQNRENPHDSRAPRHPDFDGIGGPTGTYLLPAMSMYFAVGYRF